MKLFNLDHISIIPFTTCNFKCPYCVNTDHTMTLGNWERNKAATLRFLQSLPRRAIMVSGGEPLLWNGWKDLIEQTNHTWYFLTNGSVVPSWFHQPNVKLAIVAYHKTGISIDKFVDNVKRLEVPVFVKVVYCDEQDKDSVEQFWSRGIPASLAPLEGRRYASVPEQCTTQTYRRRFLHETKGLELCRAGTKKSFEIRDNRLYGCSLWHSLAGFCGSVTRPNPMPFSLPCLIRYCRCEWHQFSELSGTNDNERWQHLVDTGIWN